MLNYGSSPAIAANLFWELETLTAAAMSFRPNLPIPSLYSRERLYPRAHNIDLSVIMTPPVLICNYEVCLGQCDNEMASDTARSCLI
jgi:hypothetical protein